MKKRHFAYLRLCILTAISLLIVTACYSGFYQNTGEIKPKPSALAAECRLVKHELGESCVPIQPKRIIVTEQLALEVVLALGIKPIAAPESPFLANKANLLGNKIVGINYIGNENQLNIEAIRKEVNGWNFDIDSESYHDLDATCVTYFSFISYQNRINQLIDDTTAHKVMLEFIIKNTKEINAQLTAGTAKIKDSVSSTILMPIGLQQTEVMSLSAFLESTQKSIEFATQQLARILREREASAKINNTDYKHGMSASWNQQKSQIVVKTKNK